MGSSPEATTDDRWHCDVLIVGAGPSGCAAAMQAAAHGLDVVVADKARFPRDKCCGDGLTTSALRQLDELGLDPASIPSWIEVSDVTLRSPRGHTPRLGLPKRQGSFAAVCRRSELDASLVDLTRSKGVSVLEGHELTDVEQDERGVHATVGELHFTARYLIAADGMWSPTRKLLGLSTPDYRGDWHAFRQYFSDVSPEAAEELVVWFEPDLLPGYAWSFPLGDGSANVGFGIRRGGSTRTKDMKQLWPDLLARPHIAEFLGPDATPEGPHRAWPIPARLGRLPLTRGRVLFVGDAGAATDPLTGEGIGQAIETGRLAVEAICVAGLDDAATAAGYYQRRLRRGMISDHRLAGRLSSMLSGPRSTEVVLRLVDASDWTRNNFARWLFEDYPRAAVFTPRRWHRGMFTGVGAFRSPPTAATGQPAGSAPDGAPEGAVTD
ncbi:MAG: geranylgeranyl reductase family protein [Actinomycetota bacterium]